MPVLIKRHRIIQNLDGKTIVTPLNLTITTFQVKDALLRAEKYSTIEVDDDVNTVLTWTILFYRLYFQNYLIVYN